MSSSPNEQTARILSELELNDYETRAYLSVLEGGVVVAREISDRASIPYAKVYQTLNSLIEKLLIVGDESRPKKFRARPPQEAIRDRLDKLESEWYSFHQNRKSKLERIIPELVALFEASDVNLQEEQGVWNIIGFNNIVSRIQSLISQTEKQILIVTGDYESFSKNFEKYFAKQKNLNIKIISGTEIDSQFETHTVENLGKGTIIFFDDFAMIDLVETAKGKYSSGEFNAVLTQISEMVDYTQQNYRRLIA